MSGWIKMGVGLRRHPKVVRIASALKADRLRVVGALHALWCVFDEHSNDGVLAGYTLAIMDDEIGWRGFSAAVQAVGWLVEDGDGLYVPEYEEHNGPTAKRRALDNQRKGKSRKSSEVDPPDSYQESGQVSASDADKTKNREEKRREEKKETPPTPRGEGRFPEFWAAWPKSPRKGGRAECLRVWQAKGIEPQADVVIRHVKALASTEGWTKAGGEYVPAPVVYLRGARWDGADVSAIAGKRTDDLYAGAI